MQATDSMPSTMLQRVALEEIENLKAIRATSWDEHTHSFRWLMASLLGINGAGCLSVISQSEIYYTFRLFAGAAFVLGIFLALLVAVFGQASIRRSLGPIQKQIGYWISVADDGLRVEAIENDLREEFANSANIGVGSRIVGWGSAILFLLGVAVAGLGITQHHAGLTIKQHNNQAK